MRKWWVVVVTVMMVGLWAPKQAMAKACCLTSECNLCPPSDTTCTDTCAGASAQCGIDTNPVDGTCARTYTYTFEYCPGGWEGWSACSEGFKTRVCYVPAQLQIQACGGGGGGGLTWLTHACSDPSKVNWYDSTYSCLNWNQSSYNTNVYANAASNVGACACADGTNNCHETNWKLAQFYLT